VSSEREHIHSDPKVNQASGDVTETNTAEEAGFVLVGRKGLLAGEDNSTKTLKEATLPAESKPLHPLEAARSVEPVEVERQPVEPTTTTAKVVASPKASKPGRKSAHSSEKEKKKGCLVS
jgi:hypothetical protein